MQYLSGTFKMEDRAWKYFSSGVLLVHVSMLLSCWPSLTVGTIAKVNLVHVNAGNIVVADNLPNGLFGTFCIQTAFSGRIMHLSVDQV